MRLSRERKEKIRSLLGRMGARQKELCQESGYASGNLSDFLNFTKEKSVTAESWARLVDALDRMAHKSSRVKLCAADPSILADVTEIRGWREGEPSSETDKEVSFVPNDNSSSQEKIHVKRQAEEDIPQIVQRCPASVIVRGGVGTGRSSWLSCLYDAAMADGAQVVAFDEAALMALDPVDPVKGFFRHLSESLNLPAIAGIDTSKGDYRKEANEVITILRQATREKTLFLLIDDVEVWSDAKGCSALAAVIGQMQLLLVGSWGQKSKFPICVVSALTPREWPALFGSRLETQSLVIPLIFLNQVQVRHLASQYGLSQQVADKIAAYTGGHPHHTQLLLWSCRRDGARVDDAIARASHLDDADGWLGISQRIHALLLRLSDEQGLDWQNLLRKFVKRYRDNDAGITFSGAEFALLKCLGMIDGPQRNASVNQFFIYSSVSVIDVEFA